MPNGGVATEDEASGALLSENSAPILPVSVIVPSRDRPEMLGECVASILAGNELPRELVIVDQSAAEHQALAEMGTVKGCRVLYRHSASRGAAAARNEGFAIANQETLLFVDDDILVAAGWLGAITRAAYSDGGTTLISGRVRFMATQQDGGFAPSLIDEDLPKIFEGRIWNDMLFSGNMACTRAVFERLGPFDPRLGAGGPYHSAEDNDYGFRALEAGYRIRYEPDALVHHQAWRSKKNYSRLQWAYGVGQGAFLTKHFRLRDRYTLTRLRRNFVIHVMGAFEKRNADPPEAKAHAARALGLIYGSVRWMMMERLRGR
jgi:GT2 family glycosyltransferase